MNKRILLALGLVASLVMGAGAVQSRRTPNASDGQPIRDALYGGSDKYFQTGTTAHMACTGKCLLLGLIRETGSVNTTVLLRDTISADEVYTANAIPAIHLQQDTGAHDNPIAFPVVFSNGISVDMSAAGPGVTVLYLDLDE